MKKGLALSVAFVLMSMVGVLVAHVPRVEAAAIEIHVPADYLNINEAIYHANDKDVVIVSPGVYSENIYFWGDKDITVRSTDPSNPTVVENTILDGSFAGSVVTFYGTSALSGFTVRNGDAASDNGGGIACWSCSPKITNCTVISNTAANGGGVYCFESQATIANCTIKGNTATAGDGGGICCSYSATPVTITNCTITGNAASAGNGGGVSSSGAPATIINTTITENSAVPSLDDPLNPFDSGISTGNGGGVYGFQSLLIIQNCTVKANSSMASSDTMNRANSGRGGGMYFSTIPSDGAIIENTTISDNVANNMGGTLTSYGGGIYCAASSFAPHFVVCAINNNSATNGGGIGCMTNARLKATGTTIQNNHATNSGGGMYCLTSGLTIMENCTIKGNEAISADGGGIYRKNCSSFPMTMYNCIIADNLAKARDGGGIYNSNNSASLELIHCTVCGNIASTTTGGGIYDTSSSTIIKNSILWFNTPNQISAVNSVPDVTYSDVKGGYGDPSVTHNINIDPEFVDRASGDYHLGSSSPCIDNAVWEPLVALDKDGQERPLDGNSDSIYGSDMGVYEADGPTLIKLDQFTAEVSATKGKQSIKLTWTTLSEIDTEGFNIRRSTTKDAEFFDIINLTTIAAKGGATEGATYSYTDRTADAGITNYYKLEDIDMRGKPKSTLHGPVSATIPDTTRRDNWFGGSVVYTLATMNWW